MQSYEQEATDHQSNGVQLHGHQLDLDDLREQLAGLIEQQENIETHQKPMLMGLYNREIGIFEFKLLQHQVERQRLMRKVELLTARINRGEAVDDSIMMAVDAKLDRELIKWRKKMLEREQQLQEGERLLNSHQAMSAEE
ncbi:MAG: hypothetical protein Q9M24_09790, partial [Mariprofundaceae bacterium]|nr:hypothetical protein [Mariprofundaceae bacterium]